MVHIVAVPTGAPQVRPRRWWGRITGRVCLWLSLVVIGVGALALCVFVLIALAHHAAPAGGGA